MPGTPRLFLFQGKEFGQMGPTMPNSTGTNFLAKVISFEFLGFLVLAGIAWGTLKADVQALDGDVIEHNQKHSTEIKEIRVEQKDQAKTIGELQRAVERIETNQVHFKEKQDTTAQDVRAIRSTIERAYGPAPTNGNGH